MKVNENEEIYIINKNKQQKYEKVNEQYASVILNIKNTSKLNNEFCNRIYIADNKAMVK